MLNKAIVAAAGSGKTTHLVRWAASLPRTARVLMTTYTTNNSAEIRKKLIEENGRVPENVEIVPWMTFLLRHGARPYQAPILGVNSISGLNTDRLTPQDKGFPKKDDPTNYYCDSSGRVYSDFLAELVLLCNERSNGAVIRRLARLFDHVFFDEIQDISARDFEILEAIMRCRNIKTVVVGDPRQGTFSTTRSRTNKKLTRSNIVSWIERMEREEVLEIERFDFSRRSNEEICRLGDSIYPSADYPSLPRTSSQFLQRSHHDGVYLVHPEDVASYAKAFEPQLLVWNKRARTHGLDARNMGEVKGLTFDRVLIQPTGSMVRFLTEDIPLADEARAKLYVAATRARYSVAFVLEEPGTCSYPRWTPEQELPSTRSA